jgi:hypothetical protein
MLPLVYALLAPIEYILMDRPTLMHLQFSGGQYHIFGLLLMLLFIDKLFNVLGTSQKTVLNFELVIFGLLTFSRVAIILSIIYLIYLFIIEKKILNIKVVFFIVVLIFLVIEFAEEFDKEYMTIIFTRFNIYSNSTQEFNQFSLDDNFENDRFEIIEYLLKRPFGEIIIGSGLGSTPAVLDELSNGNFQYGSMHNLFLTSFLERGIVATGLLIGVFTKMLFIGASSISGLFKFFLLFIFSVTTGLDLFVHSTLFDINMTLLIICFLAHDKGV